ncbi:MAG: hypothetical protein K0R28_5009 [Paenibacillus sp.]|nr:hypothetical protein [Paenibacillus sp.]
MKDNFFDMQTPPNPHAAPYGHNHAGPMMPYPGEKLPLKSKFIATVLSMMIPGTGQMYLGAVVRGMSAYSGALLLQRVRCGAPDRRDQSGDPPRIRFPRTGRLSERERGKPAARLYRRRRVFLLAVCLRRHVGRLVYGQCRSRGSRLADRRRIFVLQGIPRQETVASSTCICIKAASVPSGLEAAFVGVIPCGANETF